MVPPLVHRPTVNPVEPRTVRGTVVLAAWLFVFFSGRRVDRATLAFPFLDKTLLWILILSSTTKPAIRPPPINHPICLESDDLPYVRYRRDPFGFHSKTQQPHARSNPPLSAACLLAATASPALTLALSASPRSPLDHQPHSSPTATAAGPDGIDQDGASTIPRSRRRATIPSPRRTEESSCTHLEPAQLHCTALQIQTPST